jgi:hypothetical protein
MQKDAFHVPVFYGSDLHKNNKRLRKQFLTAKASVLKSSFPHASAIELCNITLSSYGSRHDWLYSIPCFSTSHDIMSPKSLTCQCHIFPLHKSLLPCLLQTSGSQAVMYGHVPVSDVSCESKQNFFLVLLCACHVDLRT